MSRLRIIRKIFIRSFYHQFSEENRRADIFNSFGQLNLGEQLPSERVCKINSQGANKNSGADG